MRPGVGHARRGDHPDVAHDDDTFKSAAAGVVVGVEEEDHKALINKK